MSNKSTRLIKVTTKQNVSFMFIYMFQLLEEFRILRISKEFVEKKKLQAQCKVPLSGYRMRHKLDLNRLSTTRTLPCIITLILQVSGQGVIFFFSIAEIPSLVSK